MVCTVVKTTFKKSTTVFIKSKLIPSIILDLVSGGKSLINAKISMQVRKGTCKVALKKEFKSVVVECAEHGFPLELAPKVYAKELLRMFEDADGEHHGEGLVSIELTWDSRNVA